MVVCKVCDCTDGIKSRGYMVTARVGLFFVLMAPHVHVNVWCGYDEAEPEPEPGEQRKRPGPVPGPVPPLDENRSIDVQKGHSLCKWEDPTHERKKTEPSESEAKPSGSNVW